MTNLRQAAQQALEALWYYHATEFSKDTHAGKAIAVLQAALAKADEDRAWVEERKANWAKDTALAKRNALKEADRIRKAGEEGRCWACGQKAEPEQEQEQELVIDCPRCGHCCPQRKPLTDEQAQQEPTCKQDLQVWVQRTGQFSWEPQDERFWTRMQPAHHIEQHLKMVANQPAQQEPVAWMDREGDLYKMPEIKNWAPPHTMLYTTPPQRNTEQEPVAWMSPSKERLEFSTKSTVYGSHTIPLYTAPPQRKPLTINEVEQILAQHSYAVHGDRARYIVRMTEEAHGIGEMNDDEGQAEFRYYDGNGNLIAKLDASAPLVMGWQRGSVPLGGNDCSVISKEISLEFRQPGEQVLRVTPDGEFIWHKNAESMIKNGDFSNSPALKFILQRLWSFDNKGEA